MTNSARNKKRCTNRTMKSAQAKKKVQKAYNSYKTARTPQNKRTLIIALSALAALIGIGATMAFVANSPTLKTLAERSRNDQWPCGPSATIYKKHARLKSATGLNSYKIKVKVKEENTFDSTVTRLKERIKTECTIFGTPSEKKHRNTTYTHYVIVHGKLKFHDDLELMVVPDKGEIYLRSSSRVGIYDFGVNKQRIKTIISSDE